MFLKFKAIYAKGVYLVLGIFNNCSDVIIVNTCVVAYCETEYKKRQYKTDVIPEKFPVSRFPLKNPDLNRKWIRFVNSRDLVSMQRSGVCSKHVEEEYLKVNKRATLRWELQPVPSIYFGNESLYPSAMPTLGLPTLTNSNKGHSD